MTTESLSIINKYQIRSHFTSFDTPLINRYHCSTKAQFRDKLPVSFQYDQKYFSKHFNFKIYDYYRYIRNTFIIKHLRRIMPKGNLLEIGFGDDSFVKLCKTHYHVYGLDISQWAVDKITKIYSPSNFKVCDLEKQTIPFSNKFDIVVLINTLEHFSDVQTVMKNIQDAVHQNSVLVLFLPTKSTLLSELQYRIFYAVEEHVYRPSVDDVTKLCSDFGFEQVKEFSGNFIPFELTNHTLIKSSNLYLGFFKKS